MTSEVDLANHVEGVPGRYVPGLMRGELIEAEHLGRYLWAAQIAAEKRVLDAGCGMAYGCRILSDAGAKAVVGIDIASAVVEAAAPMMPENCRIQVGDVGSLPFGNGEFDLVVCFEVIEHVHEPSEVLAELARVLAPDGVLVVSSPNRWVYPDGNPHHVTEFTPEELRGALTSHFGEIRLVRQHSWNAAVTGRRRDGDAQPAGLEHVRVYTTTDVPPGRESYVVAVAANGELPDFDDTVVLASDLEFRRWLGHFEDQRKYIDDLQSRLTAAESAAGERVQIRSLLLTAEQQLAEIPDLQDAIAERDRVIRELTTKADQLDRARRVMDDMRSSLSWRITAPLRRLKHALREPESR